MISSRIALFVLAALLCAPALAGVGRIGDNGSTSTTSDNEPGLDTTTPNPTTPTVAPTTVGSTTAPVTATATPPPPSTNPTGAPPINAARPQTPTPPPVQTMPPTPTPNVVVPAPIANPPAMTNPPPRPVSTPVLHGTTGATPSNPAASAPRPNSAGTTVAGAPANPTGGAQLTDAGNGRGGATKEAAAASVSTRPGGSASVSNGYTFFVGITLAGVILAFALFTYLRAASDDNGNRAGRK